MSAATACTESSAFTGTVDPAPPGELEVRVLGPIAIVGAEKTLTRAKSIELVVYLAMHRASVAPSMR